MRNKFIEINLKNIQNKIFHLNENKNLTLEQEIELELLKNKEIKLNSFISSNNNNK